MDEYLKLYREMISLRGLTEHTLKNYCTYIRWLQKSRGLSDRTINCAISQLRFFTLYVLHKAWDDTQLPMRRFNQYLPYVPSKQETWQFISTIPDLKQKTMVTLLYSSGLRIGDVCRLRYEYVDRKNMRLHITHSKSRNDRYAILSQAALDLLTQYWFECGRPKGFLFPKQNGQDRPIDTFFLSRHVHAHEDRLGWRRRLTCHSFRHAFGTHLYENGTDLLTIKALMGHKSLHSTTVYVHLSGKAIRSAIIPFNLLAGACHA